MVQTVVCDDLTGGGWKGGPKSSSFEAIRIRFQPWILWKREESVLGKEKKGKKERMTGYILLN